jgi:acetyl-CoA carboxylase carboxyl transferase subunit alpha
MSVLDFEKPIKELEDKIESLKQFDLSGDNINANAIKNLESDLEKLRDKIYKNMTAWQRIQIARHTERPFSLDYIHMMAGHFMELHGDRQFADDSAIVGGFAEIDGMKAMVIGQQKGRETKENIMRNFGCAHPEGYRKAMRLMRLAEKFGLPVLIFIDTPGAYPGIGAEERGQAQAIAENIRDMARIATPIVAVVIGEGGSGGALGIGVADRVLMLEHAYYSVISPEGCASILWRNSAKASEAAKALKIMSENLLEFGIVEEVIPEPLGGVHNDPESVALSIKKSVVKHIKDIQALSKEEMLENRYQKFRKIGKFTEKT